MEGGLAIFLAIVAIGLIVEAISWAGSKIDAWILRTPSKTAPLVVGLGIWGFVLVGVVVAFILGVRGL